MHSSEFDENNELKSAKSQEEIDQLGSDASTQNESYSEGQSALAGLQLLYVDDNPDTQQLFVYLLEDLGANVIAVTSAREALEVLKTCKPDIIISDIAMPEEDGYTLIRQWRAIETEQGGAIPALALTGYVVTEDQEKALDAGFQIYLSKPVDLTELVAAINSLAETVEKKN